MGPEIGTCIGIDVSVVWMSSSKHAQSTTLGPKLMFGVLSCNFVAARHPFRKRLSGCIQSTSFCHRNHFFVFRNEHGPIHFFTSKTHVWGAFVQFRCCTSPIPKTGITVHTKHEFLPPEPFLRFSQRTCPIHYFRSKTHVWVGFTQFRCRTSPIPKTAIRVHTKHEFLPPEPFLRFSQRTCPIHYFRSKTHVWVGFVQFSCRTSPIPKTGIGVHTKHKSLQPEPFLRFSQRTCPFHNFRSKTHVWGAFAQFCCRTSPAGRLH
jgi:RNA polymerase subunit RPABC4/transcription elongation factor Spt4